MISLVVALASVSLAWSLAAWALVLAGRRHHVGSDRFDAIVVLGCRVRDDGRASPTFARRIERGCELLRAGVAPKLVISGGQVGGPVTEASAGHAHIAARSLAPLDRIVLEDRATSTRTNATLTRALLGDASVLVVTCDWHTPRARRLFLRSFTHVSCASAPGRFRGALREVPSWLFDRVRRGRETQTGVPTRIDTPAASSPTEPDQLP